ncbi:uncharacterized protein EDB93DRAFT_890657 [Suillus bovinus]|uniref:uncharacterized protein n=1 Tax=Suillus bovinus TaxID=48563 RepID=UPI001B8626A1|nr:uncharacterized protein EDB93DRAFT_890657 [Suillus bovinus]KAG2132900.1 hypothetical protein EDB93DRAFT_890657 [Suillus bovinus]
MISASDDKTIRRWDLREGKEIEKAREVCEYGLSAVRVSRDGRWVVTAGTKELKVSEVETGIVRTFHEDTGAKFGPTHIQISADSTLLLAGRLYNGTVRIWRLDTGELLQLAGPFETGDDNSRLRFLQDSRKLAVLSVLRDQVQAQWLQVWTVWDVQAKKLLVQKSIPIYRWSEFPVFWTTKDKSIVTAFYSKNDRFTTIDELDASTLKTLGAPLRHAEDIHCLALSSDCVLLACSTFNSIELWAFESRQLLALFDVRFPMTLILSPDSRQLAYATFNAAEIYICNIPTDILATIGLAEEPQPSVCISP